MNERQTGFAGWLHFQWLMCGFWCKYIKHTHAHLLQSDSVGLYYGHGAFGPGELEEGPFSGAGQDHGAVVLYGLWHVGLDGHVRHRLYREKPANEHMKKKTKATAGMACWDKWNPEGYIDIHNEYNKETRHKNHSNHRLNAELRLLHGPTATRHRDAGENRLLHKSRRARSASPKTFSHRSGCRCPAADTTLQFLEA